jgi:LuxR family maltose regulon positive regulatory protein
VPELHKRASAWFEERGLLDEAIGHALQAKSFDHAADLIERAAPILHARGARLTMETWLAALPRPIAEARPRLAIMHTWMALDDGAVLWAERCLQTTEQALQDTMPPGEDRNMEGEIAAARALAATTQHEPVQAIAHAEQALQRLDQDNAVTRGVVAMSLGRAYLEQLDLSKAARILDEALSTFRSLDNRYLGLRVMLYQSYVQRAQGRLNLAIETCRQALDWTAGSSFADVGLIHLQLADLLRESNHLEAALQHTTEGMALSASVKQADLRVFAPLVMARVRQAQGNLNGALEALSQAKERAYDPEVAPYLPLLEAYEAQIWLIRGDLVTAARLAQSAGQETTRPLLEMHPLIAYTYEHLILVPIQVLIAQGRGSGDPDALTTALKLIERRREQAKRVGLVWLHVKTLALEAMAYHASGARPRALGALQTALALAQPQGYIRLFADEGEPLAELLRQIDAPDIAADYLQNIADCAAAASRNHRPDSPPVLVPSS